MSVPEAKAKPEEYQRRLRVAWMSSNSRQIGKCDHFDQNCDI
jgi:hypothetical protein